MSFKGQIFYIFNEELETTTTTTSTTTTTTTIGTLTLLYGTTSNSATVTPTTGGQAGDYFLGFIFGVNSVSSGTATAPSAPSQTGWTEIFNQTSGSLEQRNMRFIVYEFFRSGSNPVALNNMTVSGANSTRGGVILRVRRSVGSIASVDRNSVFLFSNQDGNNPEIVLNHSYRASTDMVLLVGFGADSLPPTSLSIITTASSGSDTSANGGLNFLEVNALGHYGNAPVSSDVVYDRGETRIQFIGALEVRLNT